MQRVVLDTNVIVSSVLSEDGNPYKIVDMALREKLSIYYSLEMMDEYEDVLHRDKLNLDFEKVEHLLDAIKAVGLLVSHKASKGAFSDEDDRVFYDVAKANNAILITGNKKHFPDEEFILTPTEFLGVYGE